MKDDAATSQASVRRARRLAAVLGGGALLLAGGLAMMPWLATRPRAAPDVRFTLIDGRQPSVADLRGRVVLVNFWSTTCATCMTEKPSLMELQRRNAERRFTMIAVAMSHDRPDVVVELARQRRFPFDVALDVRGEVARAFFRTETTPTKYLIDAQGQVVHTVIGGTDFGDLQRRVDQLLRG